MPREGAMERLVFDDVELTYELDEDGAWRR